MGSVYHTNATLATGRAHLEVPSYSGPALRRRAIATRRRHIEGAWARPRARRQLGALEDGERDPPGRFARARAGRRLAAARRSGGCRSRRISNTILRRDHEERDRARDGDGVHKRELATRAGASARRQRELERVERWVLGGVVDRD